MRLAVHWSECVLERRSYMIRWAEYDLAPMAPEDRSDAATPSSWRHYRLASVAVAIAAPVGSRVVTVHRPGTTQRPGGVERRLAVWWAPVRAPPGLDAETVARLAHFGRRGFRVLTAEEVAAMARRRSDDGPGLFGEDPPGTGAYGQPAGPEGITTGAREVVAAAPHGVTAPAPRRVEEVRSEIEAIAAEVIAHAERPMREAIARALGHLRAERFETARAILEGALEGDGDGDGRPKGAQAS